MSISNIYRHRMLELRKYRLQRGPIRFGPTRRGSIRFAMGLAALLYGLAVLPAGVHAQALPGWDKIGANESMIELTEYTDAGLPGISRNKRITFQGRVREELWRWTGGGLRILTVPPDRFIAPNRNSPSGLLVEFDRWTPLKAIGLEIDAADIVRGTNRIGNYYYAVSSANQRQMICLFFRQGLPTSNTHDVMFDTNEAGGEISGFECHAVGSLSAERLQEKMQAMLSTFTLKEGR